MKLKNALFASAALAALALPAAAQLATDVAGAPDFYTDPLGSADWRRGVSIELAERIHIQVYDELGQAAAARDIDCLRKWLKAVSDMRLVPAGQVQEQLLAGAEAQLADLVRELLAEAHEDMELDRARELAALASEAGLDPASSPVLRQLQHIIDAIERDAAVLNVLEPETVELDDITHLVPPGSAALEMQRHQLFELGSDAPCGVCKGEGKLTAVIDAEGMRANKTTRVALTPAGSIDFPSLVRANSGQVAPDSPTSSCSSTDDAGPSTALQLEQVCWMCRGSGRTSQWVDSLQAPPVLDDDVVCLICWGPAQYGLATTCDHFYCEDCIERSLDSMLELGQFPAYCPQCRADAGAELPVTGRIEEKTLTFLARRAVISDDIRLRVIREQRRAAGEALLFACPAECGNVLLHREPEYSLRVGTDGTDRRRVIRPGICRCGALVCVECHVLVAPDELHACAEGADVDEATLTALSRTGKRCPCCGTSIERVSGCNVILCGNNAHGSIVDAVRKGGCGFQFNWDTLEPVSSTYIGVDGESKNGIVSPEEQREAMRIARRGAVPAS